MASARQRVAELTRDADIRTTMPCHTKLEREQAMVQETLNLTLPPQPPRRIRSGQLMMPETRE